MTTDALRGLVREELAAAAAYQVPHPAGVTAKLDANELPFALPAEVRAGLARELAAVDLNRYPDPGCGELRALVGAELGAAPDELLFGNGSDEIIALLVSTFARPRAGAARARVAYPAPTFGVFRTAALAAGAEPLEIATDPEADFAIDPAALDRAMREGRPNIFIFARPNNPTGTKWPSTLVAEVARAHPDVLVVSDEAYAAYAGDGMADAVAALPNLLVMRTLSKIGLAALRVGYLRASRGIIAEVEKIRPPYNVGALNQRAAVWLLRNHRALLEGLCADVVRERARLSDALAALPGVCVFSSQANLVLFRVGVPGDGRATAAWQRLCGAGVLVRCFDRPGLLSGCLRVTVGTPAENDAFVMALRDALRG
jgi:histidinol-phosphate aminotransferase